ncbi:related to Mitochondrial nicotinamide adenine dinucleotide transporter 2 [Saccharomycodes ludwigii]|uniref:Related to Mitochondrial nicotinamide adenine dinucleotide transporter 2 n=1 Tax=Saccharomycodes ludwigii TaxID=36035 RepID=A0A376B8Y8_9ASCO|nr:related to Mitochondrial nicotinamide adenine dinucleotide transporter 2 [Saccharomycodes ludwigii]
MNDDVEGRKSNNNTNATDLVVPKVIKKHVLEAQNCINTDTEITHIDDMIAYPHSSDIVDFIPPHEDHTHALNTSITTVSNGDSNVSTHTTEKGQTVNALAILPNLPFFSRNFTDTEITALSGAVSGFLAGVSVCPLDVAKTRLQVQNQSTYYHGIMGTLKTIVRDEGVRGLYKGVVPIVLGYFPTWMIYFSVYEKCKKCYPLFFQFNFKNSDFVMHSFSAISAGAVSTICTNPIWVVKTRLMLQIKNIDFEPKVWPIGMNRTVNSKELVDNYYKVYSGTLDAFYKMYKSEGIRSFYKGLVPSFFGLLHVAIHFPVYEQLKVLFKCNQDIDPTSTTNKNLQIHRLILASCLSKMIASTLTYPHEIVRTRMQIRRGDDKTRMIGIIKEVYNKKGVSGFYSGFNTNLARTVPASVITLVSFEYIRKYLKHLNAKYAV